MGEVPLYSTERLPHVLMSAARTPEGESERERNRECVRERGRREGGREREPRMFRGGRSAHPPRTLP